MESLQPGNANRQPVDLWPYRIIITWCGARILVKKYNEIKTNTGFCYLAAEWFIV
jgi:hypothetical protein